MIIAEGRERGMNVQGELNDTLTMRKEEMKTGKAASLDICAAQCLKSGGSMAIDGLMILLNVCFVSSIVPVE